MRSLPAVWGETWRSADGRVAVFLVNHSSEKIEVAFPWNQQDWGKLRSSEIRGKCFSHNTWGKEQVFSPERIQCSIDAHSAVMLQFQ